MGSASVELANVDVVRVVEGAVGGLLVLAAVVVVSLAALRWQRERADARRVGPRVPALARVGGPLVDPAVFGAGFPAARSVRRRDTVAYGYLAVAEEYVSDDDATHWCTLGVDLPGRVPELVVDHRAALGRPGVAGLAARLATGDPAFDATYAVTAGDAQVVARVLPPAVRDLLLVQPVQRLALRERAVLVRSFDDAVLDADRIAALVAVVGRFLASTPSFVTHLRDPITGGDGEAALPAGLYGLDPASGLS